MKEQLASMIKAALEHLQSQQIIPADHHTTVTVQRCKQPEHGDLATNVALTLAKQAGMPRAS